MTAKPRITRIVVTLVQQVILWPTVALLCLVATELGISLSWWVHVLVGWAHWYRQPEHVQFLQLHPLLAAMPGLIHRAGMSRQLLGDLLGQSGGGSTIVVLIAATALLLCGIDAAWRHVLGAINRTVVRPSYAQEFPIAEPSRSGETFGRWFVVVMCLLVISIVVTFFVGSTRMRWNALLLPFNFLAPRPHWFLLALAVGFVCSVLFSVRNRLRLLRRSVTPEGVRCGCDYSVGTLPVCPECGVHNAGLTFRVLWFRLR